MPSETVLIRIVTAANMAGVSEAKAGFLGMNPAILAAGVALAILVKVGKDAVENTKKQETAFLSVAQAVAAYNAHLGKNAAAHKVFIHGTKATAAGLANLSIAQKRLVIATQEVTLAQERLTRAIFMYGPANARTLSARIALERATLRLSAAEKAAGSSAGATAGHYKNIAATHRLAAISLEDYTKRVEAFIATNKAYITNQYDVVKAAADIVRAGNNEKDSMRILNDALDLAVIRTESVSTATETLIRALHGNAKALKALGISEQYAAIEKNKHLSAEQKHLAILKLVETKTKDGKKATDGLAQSQNTLNKDWQDFTTRIGPGVTGMLNGLITAADRLVQLLDLGAQLIGKLSQIDASHPVGRPNVRPGHPAPAYTAPVSPTGGHGVIHVHGSVTLVTPGAHTATLAASMRSSDRSKR